MSKRDPRVRLLHMRDYAQKAVSMAESHTRDDLDEDEKLMFALTHLVELVGEAASQVPAETRAENQAIPWPSVIGIRNKLIHEYEDIDYDILWDTVNEGLPELIHELNKIIGEDD